MSRNYVIDAFDDATLALRTYVERCPADEAARLVGLLPELVALRDRFEEATAPSTDPRDD